VAPKIQGEIKAKPHTKSHPIIMVAKGYERPKYLTLFFGVFCIIDAPLFGGPLSYLHRCSSSSRMPSRELNTGLVFRQAVALTTSYANPTYLRRKPIGCRTLTLIATTHPTNLRPTLPNLPLGTHR
jgi:hypothetical protein